MKCAEPECGIHSYTTPVTSDRSVEIYGTTRGFVRSNERLSDRCSVPRVQDRPNVVIMLADNVGYGDIGAYGAGEIRGMPTPRIDSIASQGLRSTQFLVQPGCTPSRAALLTGRYSPRAGQGVNL